MLKYKRSSWLFAVAGIMFVIGGLIGGDMTYLAIGGMFVALSFTVKSLKQK